MTTLPASVVFAEPVTHHKWRTYISGGYRDFEGPPCDSRADLIRFADYICCTCRVPDIRTVLLLIPDGPVENRGLLTSYPRCVHAISTNHALACALEVGWTKAVAVDLSRGTKISLLVGDGDYGCVLEQPIVDTRPSSVGLITRTLGIRDVVIRFDEKSSELAEAFFTEFEGINVVVSNDSDDLIAGIQRFAARLQSRSGVSVAPDGTLSMQSNRPVSYSISHTPRAVFDLEEPALATLVADRKALIVIDANVDRFYGKAIRAYAKRWLRVCSDAVIEVSESTKDWQRVEHICRAASNARLGRRGLIIGVGGGVTLDLAGMAASVYRRGTAFIRVPTTLVGLIDVSVGIKQGINAFGSKNILGAFHPPIASLNDYTFLRTCSPISISCGLAEILKMALIRDESLLNMLEQHGAVLLASRFQCPAGVCGEVARRAELLMMEELAPNLFETDFARLVDFGHTFSPVIETHANYRIPHGRAVALDMLLSTTIAVEKGFCSPLLRERLVRLMKMLGLPIWDAGMPVFPRLMNALELARLHRGGSLNLVIPTEPGNAMFVQEVSVNELQAGVRWMQGRARMKAGNRCNEGGRVAHANAGV